MRVIDEDKPRQEKPLPRPTQKTSRKFLFRSPSPILLQSKHREDALPKKTTDITPSQALRLAKLPFLPAVSLIQ